MQEKIATQAQILRVVMSQEITKLIVKLRKPRPGVRVERWADVDVAPLAKSHLATLWGLPADMPVEAAALYATVDETIEDGHVPRRIRIPRYGVGD